LDGQSIKRLTDDLTNSTSASVINEMGLATSLMLSFNSQRDNSTAQQASSSMRDAYKPRLSDPVDSIRAWARFLVAPKLGGSEAEDMVRNRMLTDSAWQDRLLGLALLTSMTGDARLPIAEQVAKHDTDPTVRAFAAAFVDGLKAIAPASQPTTGPATTQATTQPSIVLPNLGGPSETTPPTPEPATRAVEPTTEPATREVEPTTEPATRAAEPTTLPAPGYILGAPVTQPGPPPVVSDVPSSLSPVATQPVVPAPPTQPAAPTTEP
jgi:hypothetical protein